MPAWIDTKAEEKAWKKAKAIVRKQRNKKEDDFQDRDWALVTHIAKGILGASLSASAAQPLSDAMVYALANVETILTARRKKARKDKDADLPAEVAEMVAALSQVMAFGGQSIAALRKSKKTGMSEEASAELAEKLRGIAEEVRGLLSGLK